MSSQGLEMETSCALPSTALSLRFIALLYLRAGIAWLSFFGEGVGQSNVNQYISTHT